MNTDQATTQPASAERPSVDSAPAVETAATDTATENNATNERPDESIEDSFDAGIKIDELPENVRDVARGVEKQFKSAFTKKTQELSARRKKEAYEAEQLKGQVQRYETMLREVLSDPAKAESYRRASGLQNTQPEPTPQFETVEDLINYYDTRTKNLEQQLEQKFEQKLHQTLTEKEQLGKWTATVDKLYSTDPTFKKYHRIIMKMAQDDPKYREIYYPGNEEGVLRASLNDFKEMLKPELEAVRNETLKSLEAKKQATTFVPKRNIETITPGQKLDKDDIINRVRQKLGKL